ncbi:MAG: electron transfer flavoprotein subunit beta/FixA family protein [Chloroflexi bacterium]|nr:electron transfer flavoprotein subunit beta/FixA family protein [Chloroflexota bacterium]
MPYDIIVCLKQVPHPDYLGKITLDRATGTIVRAGIPCVVNPGDRNAVEEALRIRERYAGKITAITMGPPEARKAMEDVLALETDTAVHLCDYAFAGADTLATARALASGIRRLGHFDLILCGDTTIDSGTGQVAVQLAELLDLPCVTNVESIAFEDGQSLIVTRHWERGHVKVRMKLPGVLAVTERINEPRLPTILGIMGVAQKEIATWGAALLGVDTAQVGLCGSPTRFLQIGEFHAKRHGEVLKGPPEAMVTEAVNRLKRMELL